MVGWHAVTNPGPSQEFKLFTNIATDPLDVAKAAASFAVADSGGMAGVVIFTDSTYAIAIAKSDAMAKEYYRLGSDKNDIVSHLIYPIPDPALPFSACTRRA